MTVLRKEVFDKTPGDRLRIYAVWQPILPSDTEEELPEATALLAAEPRVTQYWDPRGEAGRQFARALELPMKTPAWDVYLLYPSRTRWDQSSPLPGFWMHQLSFPPWSEAGKRFGKLRLDGTRFQEEVRKVIQEESRRQPAPPASPPGKPAPHKKSS